MSAKTLPNLMGFFLFITKCLLKLSLRMHGVDNLWKEVIRFIRFQPNIIIEYELKIKNSKDENLIIDKPSILSMLLLSS